METKKLYVGNLSYSSTKEEVEELFTQFGQVESVHIIEGKGFGFVEMSTQAEAQAAKEKINGFEFKGRLLRVSEAKPQSPKGGRSFNKRY